MILLAIDWSAVGIKILQFILSFSILVVLHELGHFLPARWFKCRVEKFYLFFNPWFSIFKKKIGETAYLGYGIENDWEIVPGTWTFEIWYSGRKLAEQSFTLSR